MRYLAIRKCTPTDHFGEVIAIAKIPNLPVGSVYCDTPDDISYTEISEAEYTTYQALDLFPILEHFSKTYPHLCDTYADIYDPRHYEVESRNIDIHKKEIIRIRKKP